MKKINIDGIEVEVDGAMTIIQAAEVAGIEIPRFCYHERLSIAGNCRMCLVEVVGGPPKPAASCAMQVRDLRPGPNGEAPVVKTKSPMVKKAREGVMEFLLINHPLDCPICDQGGECDLQDQAMAYGVDFSRYREPKRASDDLNLGPLVATKMTRCISCTRCVRFTTEVAGITQMGQTGRGEDSEITSYLNMTLDSNLQGNIIDLCPVGALTSKPYAFTARPWELKHVPSIDVMDAVGTNIDLGVRGPQVMRVNPRINDDVNEEWASDKTRFAADGLMKRRLDRPYVRKDGKLVAASWGEAFAAIAEGLNGLKGAQIAGVVGDLADVEAMVALKDLLAMRGVARIESRQDGALVDPAVPAGYRFNSGIAGIAQADVILLVGTNPRWEAALVNTRLRQAVRKGKAKVLNIGPCIDLTYPVEQLGDDLAVLAKLPKAVTDALKGAERPAIVLGMGALKTPGVLAAARALADKHKLVRDGWNGWNVLHTAAARVGALDLGLAAEGGVAGIAADVKAGKVKAVFNLGADELPAGALAKAFTVYIGTHGDAGVKDADVILPAAAYTEKSGTWVNTEGRVQRGTKATPAPGDAREDWTILRALSDVLGAALPYDTLAGLRERIARDWPHLASEGVAAMPWGAVFTTDDAKPSGPVALAVDNFYLTNPIARASDTMHDCVREILGQGGQLEAAE
ncbi:MAG: NADH-quinone oxidoreductase subunit G [Alphaproteobacteria bacterium]|nr:NADH-quinone oxidoreductase subunit G [Alphaproteobacteria bacterium]